MQNNQKGLSLIELSIVLVVLALMVGGVVASRVMIRSARLANAQNLAANSPVTDMDSLVFWSETSMISKEVNLSEPEIEEWEDNSVFRKHATQTTTAEQPIFIESDILAGLNSIYFDGSNDGLETDSIVNAVKYTAFVVFNTRGYTNSGTNYFFFNGNNSGDGWGLSTVETDLTATALEDEITISRIATVVYDGSDKVIRINKRQLSSTSVAPASNIQGAFYIGSRDGTGNIEAEIAEIIIFNRDLFTTEVDEIEDYLYKKYMIRD